LLFRIFAKKKNCMINKKRVTFSSKLGMILAAVGSAVGLGNIWRFPYEAGANGGGAFIIVYILCVFLIGMVAMIAEFLIGKMGRKNVVDSFNQLKPNSAWHYVGYIGLLAGVLIMGNYVVVSGWTLKYFLASSTFGLQDLTVSGYEEFFIKYTASSFEPIIYLVIFMFISHLLLSRGVKTGIEKASKIMMPILFILLLVLVINSLLLPNAIKGLEFLFKPDFSSLSYQGVLAALAQAFFSLSLGMGAMLTYSSYFREDVNIMRTTAQVVVLDTMVALLSGMVIFPAVFAYGASPEAGPGLVFKVLPNVFNQMPLGVLWSSIFYLVLIIACLTSLMSLHEVVIAYFMDKRGLSRRKASLLITIVVIVLGILSSLSMGKLNDLRLFGKTFFDILDFISASICLPLGGMLMSIFVAWILGKDKFVSGLTNDGKIVVNKTLLNVVFFLLKYIVPMAILIIFITSLL